MKWSQSPESICGSFLLRVRQLAEASPGPVKLKPTQAELMAAIQEESDAFVAFSNATRRGERAELEITAARERPPPLPDKQRLD
jgi:hypothetical protein